MPTQKPNISMVDPDLQAIEADIDTAFAENKLAQLPYAHCMWTILSVVEDHHFKILVYNPLPDDKARIYVDGLMNSLTHPLRVCHRKSAKGNYQFRRRLVGDHYDLANKWLKSAEDYNHFCTMFPLYHSKQLILNVRDNEIIPSDWNETNLSYEVYDRFVLRRNPDADVPIDPTLALRELEPAIRMRRHVFSVNLTDRLVRKLIDACEPSLRKRYSLPEHWKFHSFSLREFRSVMVCIQSLAAGWFLARQIAGSRGTSACGYSSSVWTPKKSDFVRIISRSTGVRESAVASIVRYMTFGELGIRWPDIAIQPIIDLTNSEYAISPFLFMHANVERNLCVLLNQIPVERSNYSRLVNEKEEAARSELIESLAEYDLDVRFGKIEDTDIDLAIIDRSSKKCLCVEIKWFIEPAEVREVLDRSKEISKGVAQALKIKELFEKHDERLLKLLELDHSYDFATMVGSYNFIGRHGVQHPDIPITKLWHLGAKIRDTGDLGDTIEWLRSRQYLPKRDVDFKINQVDLVCGNWKSRWYGIAYTK